MIQAHCIDELVSIRHNPVGIGQVCGKFRFKDMIRLLLKA